MSVFLNVGVPLLSIAFYNGWVNTAHLGKLDKEAAGGSKVLECEVYAGAFNYLPVHDFIEHLEAAPWNGYSLTTVVIETESEFRAIFRPGRELIEDRADD